MSAVIDGSKDGWRPGGAPWSVAKHPGGAQGGESSVTLLVSSGRGRASDVDGTRGRRPVLSELGRVAPGPDANGGGRLRLYLQPQAWLGSGGVAGFVASARGDQHLEAPGNGEQGSELHRGTGPDSSDPAVVIGGWLVAQATRTLGRWRDEGLTADLTVSASVSASSLRTPGFGEAILAGIDASGLPPSHFVLHLPRHAFDAERDAVRMSIAGLHARGVGVAVEDLEAADARAAVPGLLINQLIINQSLIFSLGRDSARTALVRELASLARLLGAVAVADGIETEHQALAAHEAGCRLGRGPYIGEARPADEVERDLRAARSQG